jgi:hypothetical protein
LELANALFPSPRRELLLSSACTVVGAPAIAQLAAALLEDAGHVVKRSPNRGLDHGAWVPLRLMYSQADIPVLQLSLVRGATAADHEKLGRALVTLRNEGILIIGSGSLTHNVYELSRGGIDAPVPGWLADLGAWMKTMLDENQREYPRGAHPRSATIRQKSICCRCSWRWARPGTRRKPSGCTRALNTGCLRWTSMRSPEPGYICPISLLS